MLSRFSHAHSFSLLHFLKISILLYPWGGKNWTSLSCVIWWFWYLIFPYITVDLIILSLYFRGIFFKLPTPAFWPGGFHRLYTPYGHKESDMTERLTKKKKHKKTSEALLFKFWNSEIYILYIVNFLYIKITFDIHKQLYIYINYCIYVNSFTLVQIGHRYYLCVWGCLKGTILYFNNGEIWNHLRLWIFEYKTYLCMIS